MVSRSDGGADNRPARRGGRAEGQPVRAALVVGNNLGDARDEPLRYAENDAERMATLLVRFGSFVEDDTLLLNARTADDVRRAFVTIAERFRGVPAITCSSSTTPDTQMDRRCT